MTRRSSGHCWECRPPRIVRGGALAVDVEALKPAAGAALYSGHAVEKIIEVPAIVGQIRYLLAQKQGAEPVLRGLYQRSDTFHFDGFRHLSRLELKVCLRHQ